MRAISKIKENTYPWNKGKNIPQIIVLQKNKIAKMLKFSLKNGILIMSCLKANV